MTKTCFVRT